MIMFWPLESFLRRCQYPINHAAGIDAMEEPRENGNSCMPASSGVYPFTV